MLSISPARLAANRRNAQKSTGPTTEAGKEASRRNALKHGMCAVTVRVEDEVLVRERAIGVYETFKPQTAFQAWVCATIAIITIRLDRLRDLEKQIRKGASWRAASFWDDDQRDEASRVGARLARNPAKVVSLLRRSVAGCDWLIERWSMLLSVAQRTAWTDDQKGLANDLLGTPPELRVDAPGFTVATDGQTLDTGADEVALALAMLADLKLHQERVDDADAIARQLAMADLDDFNNPNLVRCRRYERSLQNEFHRLCTLSQFESPQAAPGLKFPASIPAHFFDPPLTPNEPTIVTPAIVLNEAIAATPPVIPNEPIVVVAPVVRNEPIIAAIPPVVRNEPTVANAPGIRNEPTVAVAPVVRNEPTFPSFGLGLPPTTGMDPALVALLEDGFPDADSLDPAWCRELIMRTFDVDAEGRVSIPPSYGKIPRTDQPGTGPDRG